MSVLRKKDWRRLDRVFDYKYFTGATMGAGVSMMAAATPLTKFWTGLALVFVVSPLLALFWDFLEEKVEGVVDQAS